MDFKTKKAKMLVIKTIDISWECPYCKADNIQCIPIVQYENNNEITEQCPECNAYAILIK